MFTQHNILEFKTLVANFQKEKRDFPWRSQKTPYRVWVSEIMLQQTRAEVVVPYYLHWIQLFPSIQALAEAPLEKVLKAWEGLGYYRRARNLHKGALYVVEHFRGILPPDVDLLQKIPGIGSYTAAAILAFAFGRNSIAFDCNVERVLARYFLISKIQSKVEKKNLTHLFLQYLPPDSMPILAEALIEHGSCVCRVQRPLCQTCPLQIGCQAKQKNLIDLYPEKKKKPQTIKLTRNVFLFEHQAMILLKKEENETLMGYLYQLPFINVEIGQHSSSIREILEEVFLLKNHEILHLSPLKIVKQHFTIYNATLFPYRVQLSTKTNLQGYNWIDKSLVVHKPFCSGHRKILQQVNIETAI